MNGEPQPPDVGDELDRQLHVLRSIWFGLFAGGFIITLTIAMVVMSGGGVRADLGALKYAFLLPMPFGLFGAYILAPWLAAPNPSLTPHAGGVMNTTARTPDDVMYWYPAYMSRFFVRAGFLEGNTILCAIGLFLTADWVILAGPAILLAALLASMPTRSGVEAFAADARQRMQSGE